MMGKRQHDDVYIRHMQVLQDIRDKCGGQLSLPQICVVGDQSSGKSSALACITGITFPVKSGICTKAPIVVECRHDQTLDQPVFEIQDQSSQLYHPVELRALAAEIENIQNKLLDSKSGSTPERPKISRDEIRVKVCGREQIDLVVVDLPGIINAGDGKEATRELICRYIKDKQTLILLVSEAKQDAELTGALDLAKEFDPTLDRTLRLLTKFDTFDSPEARNTAVGLIKEQIPLKLGSHALVCRSAGGDYDTKEESKVLSQAQVPEERAGVDTLKGRLPPVFAEMMRHSLPGLESLAKTKLEESKKILESIGREPINQTTMILHCQSVLNRSLFEEQVTPSMKAFQEAVHKTEENVTQEWVNKRLKENVFTCPFFQGDTAFRTCLKDMTEMWKPHVENLIIDVEQRITKVIKSARSDNIGVSKTLWDKIQTKWMEHYPSLITDFRSKCIAVLKQEMEFGTMNHYLVDKYHVEQEVMPDDFAEVLIRHLMSGGKFDLPNITARDGPAKSSAVLEISGVNDSRAAQLNGLYVLVDDIHNGKPLFKKEGAEVWLLFQKDKKWCFTDTESKNANNYAGYCWSVEAGIDNPVRVVLWCVLDENEERQFLPSIKLKGPLGKDLLQLELHSVNIAATSMQDRLQQAKTEWATIRKKRTLHEHLQPRLLAAVRAAFTVEKKTFTDMVLKVCRDSIISGVARWVETELLIDKDIRDAAVEDAILRDERMQHKRTIDNMDYALRTLGPIMEEAAQMIVTKKEPTDKKATPAKKEEPKKAAKKEESSDDDYSSEEEEPKRD